MRLISASKVGPTAFIDKLSTRKTGPNVGLLANWGEISEKKV